MDRMSSENKRPVIWLQLTAGQGPKECGWVVAQISQIILKLAAAKNLSAERVETLAFDKLLRKQDVIEPDAFLSILIRLEGEGVNAFSKEWAGTIKWQGESPYRPKHKRINWFVGIAMISMQDDKEIEGSTLVKDVKFESMRSKGPGGQHVNKTNSAVRVTHLPTGLQVRVESDRSQHRNKHLAMERLQLILLQIGNEKEKSLEHARWQHHYDVKRGNPIRTFYGIKFTENN